MLCSSNSEPEKVSFIDCTSIVKLVETQGLLPNFSMRNHYIEMTFDVQTDSFAWEVSTYRQKSLLVSDHLRLNALTGKLIRQWVEHAAF